MVTSVPAELVPVISKYRQGMEEIVSVIKMCVEKGQKGEAVQWFKEMLDRREVSHRLEVLPFQRILSGRDNQGKQEVVSTNKDEILRGKHEVEAADVQIKIARNFLREKGIKV